MMGQASWITLAFIGGGAVVVALLGYYASRASKAGRHRFYETHKIVCPRHRVEADCVFVRNAETGAVESVARCDLFDDPERVRCDEKCRDELPARPHTAFPHSERGFTTGTRT
jgi:hypothetical protein